MEFSNDSEAEKNKLMEFACSITDNYERMIQQFQLGGNNITAKVYAKKEFTFSNFVNSYCKVALEDKKVSPLIKNDDTFEYKEYECDSEIERKAKKYFDMIDEMDHYCIIAVKQKMMFYRIKNKCDIVEADIMKCTAFPELNDNLKKIRRMHSRKNPGYVCNPLIIMWIN
jgi:hypothetical protein